MLGERRTETRLYPLIQVEQGSLAGKMTGMLLEGFDNSYLVALIHEPGESGGDEGGREGERKKDRFYFGHHRRKIQSVGIKGQAECFRRSMRESSTSR